MHNDIFDVLAAGSATNAVATLYLHSAATVCASKRVSVTRTKFLEVISCSADHFQKLIKMCPREADNCSQPLFCFRDLDINPMTQKHDGDLDILKM